METESFRENNRGDIFPPKKKCFKIQKPFLQAKNKRQSDSSCQKQSLLLVQKMENKERKKIFTRNINRKSIKSETIVLALKMEYRRRAKNK